MRKYLGNYENKKVLIHLGYPKTASTTLQENIFLDLHKSGKINYLGRVYLNKDRFKNTDYAIKIRKLFLKRKSLIKILKKINLKTNIINVISDENYSMPKMINRIQYSSDVDPLNFPKFISNTFFELDITFLLTIRRQSDMLFSLFVQKYKFLYSKHYNITFEEFLLCKDSSLVKNEFRELFNFNKIYEIVRNLNKNGLKQREFEILFFEDLKHNQDYFCSKLAKILKCPMSEIKKSLNKKEWRKKRIKHNNIDVEINKLRFVFQPFRKYLVYNYNDPTLKLRFLNMFFFKRELKSIPIPNQEFYELIDKQFEESNHVFFREMNLDKNKGLKYKYFENIVV